MAAQEGFLHINLLPKDSFNFSALGRFLTWATTTGRVLVVLTEFVVLLAFGSRFYFDKRVNDLKEEMDQKQTQIEAFAETEQTMKILLAKQAPIDNFLSNGLSFGRKYDQLSGEIPRDVRLEKLTIDGKGMSLVGESQTELGFAQLLANLKNDKSITKISMKDTSFDQNTGTVKFNIQTSFQ